MAAAVGHVRRWALPHRGRRPMFPGRRPPLPALRLPLDLRFLKWENPALARPLRLLLDPPGRFQAVGASRQTRDSPGHRTKAISPTGSFDRPSLGNVNRPALSAPGVATRPAPVPTPGGSRPGVGGNRPGTGIARPTPQPAGPEPAANVPSSAAGIAPVSAAVPARGTAHHRWRNSAGRKRSPNHRRRQQYRHSSRWRQHQHWQHQQSPRLGTGWHRRTRPLGRPLVRPPCSPALSRLVSRLLERELGPLLVCAGRGRRDGLGAKPCCRRGATRTVLPMPTHTTSNRPRRPTTTRSPSSSIPTTRPPPTRGQGGGSRPGIAADG